MPIVSSDRTVLHRPSVSARHAVIFLAVTHLAGVIGYLVPALCPWFQALTPFHLLLTTSLLLYFHSDWRSSFLVFVLVVSQIGYWVEVIGVRTSLIFGDYAYDTTLGPKLLEVPLMIGVNWVLMTYLCGSVCARLPIKKLYKVFIAALLMVGVDILIEPVAIKYDFWHWANGTPPLHNYIGWLGTALLVQSLFSGLSFRKENPIAAPLLIIQLLFYTSLLLP